MLQTANRILDLTNAVAEAAASDDLPRCDELLAERGVLVQDMAREHAAAGGGEPPAEVRDVLARVRAVDQELERLWRERMDETGRELARVSSRAPKKKHDADASCIINRMA